MDRQNESNKSIQKNSDIKINKKMRVWNKYKNYIVGFIGILVIVLLVVFLLKGCGNDTSDNNKDSATTDQNNTVTNDPSNEASKSADGQTQSANQSTTQATTQAVTGNKVYSTSKVVAKEDFATSSFYNNSVFLGDSIVSGIEYYGHLDTNKVIADTNMTTDKALGYVDELVSYAPQKVFIMLGINDLNYGTRGTDTMVANYVTLINQIKAKLPSAKIYIVSVLPITQAYEAKSTVYIKKTNLDELNNKLKAIVTTSGVDYLDLATVFQGSNGYLNESVTSNGLNISNDYYGFILNTIADMLK